MSLPPGPHGAGPHGAGPHAAGPHAAGPHAAGPHAAGKRWGPAHRVGEVVAVLAVSTMVAGTFAPWLQSGSTQRNLYGTAGVVQRLAQLGNPVGVVLNALPLLSLYCVLAGVGYALGWRRTAGLSTTVVAAALGSIAAAAVVHRGGGTIHIVAAGPTITLIGASISVIDLLVLVFAGRRPAPLQYPAPSALTSTMELT